MNGAHRNPDDGSHSDDPTDSLSPRREDDVLVAGRLELNDDKYQDDLQQESSFEALVGDV